MEDCYLYCSILFTYLLQLWYSEGGGGRMLVLYKKLPARQILFWFLLLQHNSFEACLEPITLK